MVATVTAGAAIGDGAVADGFDWAVLAPAQREMLTGLTAAIRIRADRMAEDIIVIGQALQQAKDALPRHYLAWLKAEVGMSPSSAERFRRVYRAFAPYLDPTAENVTVTFSRLKPTALYRLARTSTPPAARAEAMRRASQGETITEEIAEAIVSPTAAPVWRIPPLTDVTRIGPAEVPEGLPPEVAEAIALCTRYSATMTAIEDLLARLPSPADLTSAFATIDTCAPVVGVTGTDIAAQAAGWTGRVIDTVGRSRTASRGYARRFASVDGWWGALNDAFVGLDRGNPLAAIERRMRRGMRVGRGVALVHELLFDPFLNRVFQPVHAARVRAFISANRTAVPPIVARVLHGVEGWKEGSDTRIRYGALRVVLHLLALRLGLVVIGPLTWFNEVFAVDATAAAEFERWEAARAAERRRAAAAAWHVRREEEEAAWQAEVARWWDDFLAAGGSKDEHTGALRFPASFSPEDRRLLRAVVNGAPELRRRFAAWWAKEGRAQVEDVPRATPHVGPSIAAAGPFGTTQEDGEGEAIAVPASDLPYETVSAAEHPPLPLL